MDVVPASSNEISHSSPDVAVDGNAPQISVTSSISSPSPDSSGDIQMSEPSPDVTVGESSISTDLPPLDQFQQAFTEILDREAAAIKKSLTSTSSSANTSASNPKLLNQDGTVNVPWYDDLQQWYMFNTILGNHETVTPEQIILGWVKSDIDGLTQFWKPGVTEGWSGLGEIDTLKSAVGKVAEAFDKDYAHIVKALPRKRRAVDDLPMSMTSTDHNSQLNSLCDSTAQRWLLSDCWRVLFGRWFYRRQADTMESQKAVHTLLF
jgi:hypothetical protein